MTEFKNTFNLFNDYLLAYTTERPLSYNTWVNLPNDYKAAALYVNFYEQITLAYNKVYTKAAIEEECVSEVIKYLIKNVPIIEDNESKYSARYIYSIMYNCLYCKSIDPYKGQTAKQSWYNNTVSNCVLAPNGEELNLFDTIISNEDIGASVEFSNVADKFEKLIFKVVFGEHDHTDIKEKGQTEWVKLYNPDGKVLKVDGKVQYAENSQGKRIKRFKIDMNGNLVKTEIHTSYYNGGLDENTKAVVSYLMGTHPSLTAAQKAKMPEVVEFLRNRIEENFTMQELEYFNIFSK